MPAQSKTSKELFQKYPNKIFIETGTYHGDSVQLALDAGFEKIYSIELSNDLFKKCQERFKNNDKIILICDDSSSILPHLLGFIKEPVTFWLDSHYSGADTVMGDSNTPLLRELEIIKNHNIKTHTIMIDDLRGWYKHTYGFDTLDLMRVIKEISADYKFMLEDGFIPNDILVAKCL